MGDVEVAPVFGETELFGEGEPPNVPAIADPEAEGLGDGAGLAAATSLVGVGLAFSPPRAGSRSE